MASLAAPGATPPFVFDTKQRILAGATATLVPLFVCMVSGILTTRARNPALTASPAMPRATDMGIATAFALVLLALRPVVVDLYSPLARLALPEQFRTNDFRVKRFSTWMFKMTYYTVLAAVGYWLQKDEAWFPVSLGGNGDASLSFAIVDTPPSYALKLYVLMTFAFLMHNLLFVLFCKPFESDTMEYVVHDCTGMLLIGTSYFVNYTAPAAIIAFLNDSCDIFACASKMGTDSRRMWALAPTLVGFLFSWWYTRLFVFPTECLRALIVDAPRLDPHVSMLFLQPLQGMFTILLVLQAYWYWGMARKGLRVLFQVAKIQSKEPAGGKSS